MSAAVNRLSRLTNSFLFPLCEIQIFISYDIISNSPLDRYNCLWNPANEALTGPSLPYFAIGGPVPPLVSGNNSKKSLSSSSWGGMDAGQNMLYPIQCIDGCVHSEAGGQLLSYLQSLPPKYPFIDAAGQTIRCPVGDAVSSPSFGLSAYFDYIIHTVPPFANECNWEQKLSTCYMRSFQLSASLRGMKDAPTTITTALLGSGTRGISIDNAALVAAKSCKDYSASKVAAGDQKNCIIHFVLRDEEHSNTLAHHLSTQLL
jgi:O-acetyl-ADP-ribose deacetylase (regulator of RNase III)